MYQGRTRGRDTAEIDNVQRKVGPGKHTLTEALTPVQRVATAGAEDPAHVHAAAARGTATASTRLPFADQIQRAFGRHDISGIQAHVGGDADESARDMGARAYAMGDHVVLGGSADLHTVAHEAAHVVQQRGGVQLKGGVGQVGDAYEHHADAVADLVVSGKSAESLLDQHAPAGGKAAGGKAIQRWAQPGEDAAANRKRDQLDGIERRAIEERDRARDLSTAVPASLRAHWAGANYIDSYTDANALRLNATQAQALAQPATRTLAQLSGDVQQLGQQVAPLKARIDAFEVHYQGMTAAINAQTARQATLTDVLADGNGAARQAQWTGLATAIRTMNLGAMTANLAAFQAPLATGTFNEAEVAAVRLAGAPAARTNAVIQFLTELFASGQLVLDTWSKTYPTNFDLKTGEFGAEWYLKCAGQAWLGQKWVFHAHCVSTRDDHGNHTGFQFKNILGCNHLKMQSERMALGVALDLPLSAGTLTAMAGPYQDLFLTRMQDDSQFRAALKKAR
jgi:hypothetical protein